MIASHTLGTLGTLGIIPRVPCVTGNRLSLGKNTPFRGILPFPVFTPDVLKRELSKAAGHE